jgi:hypothetical protein
MFLICRAVSRAGRRATTIALVACALVAACDEAPPAKTDPGVTEAAPPKEKLAELPAQMVAAVSSGRTSETIGVHFMLESAPAVGKPLAVQIAIVPHRAFTGVSALFEASDSLGMTAGKIFDGRKNVDSEAVLTHKLVLQPSQEGVFLVTAAVDTVDTEDNDGVVTRIYTIPIIVHPDTDPAKPAGNPSPAPPAS